MKKLILIFFPFLFVSCSVKHKKTFDYIFNKTEAITLEQSKLTLSKDITVLSFSDSSMVDRNSSIIKVDSGWIVYSKNSESSILSFTSDGQFSGYIGHRGNGPGEYTSVYDVAQVITIPNKIAPFTFLMYIIAITNRPISANKAQMPAVLKLLVKST